MANWIKKKLVFHYKPFISSKFLLYFFSFVLVYSHSEWLFHRRFLTWINLKKFPANLYFISVWKSKPQTFSHTHTLPHYFIIKIHVCLRHTYSSIDNLIWIFRICISVLYLSPSQHTHTHWFTCKLNSFGCLFFHTHTHCSNNTLVLSGENQNILSHHSSLGIYMDLLYM